MSGLNCDSVCDGVGGGNHNSAATTTTPWADTCSGATGDDVVTWFFENGNPADWTATLATDLKTMGHGDDGGNFYGKCVGGSSGASGAWPKASNSDANRSLVCACFKTCPPASGLAIGGPYERFGNYCYYLGAAGESCDDVCTSMTGSNLYNAAVSNFPADTCSAPNAQDLSTWFYDHGNPGGWSSAGGTTGLHSLGYGYTAGAWYGKCAAGGTASGAAPGESNSNADRALVCACFGN